MKKSVSNSANKVISISKDAFNNSNHITDLILNSNIDSIDSIDFNLLPSLKNIFIPYTIKNIPDSLGICKNLDNIYNGGCESDINLPVSLKKSLTTHIYYNCEELPETKEMFVRRKNDGVHNGNIMFECPRNKKLVFLDIDGVLNFDSDKDLMRNVISKSRLEILLKLTHSYPVVCVIIISDRRLYDGERTILDSIFEEYDIEYYYLSYIRKYKDRSDEVLNYIDKVKNMHGFVIIDDYDLGYTNTEKLKNHFVKVNKGLNEDILDDIIQAMNR